MSAHPTVGRSVGRSVGPRVDGPRVVVLNGGSSSGKSALSAVLVDLLPGTWLRLNVDTLIDALPSSFDEVEGGLVLRPDGTIETGPEWRRVERAWMGGIAAVAREVAVVVEDGFLSGPVAQQRWREALEGMQVLWVGVRCDPEVAAARERDRGDRVLGMARAQALSVHEGIDYDLEVDTSGSSPKECAAVVAAHVSTPDGPNPR
ncbi:AAA family ATPase [Pedococcus sp. KACC 23699]|uniref:AAA family ATPase n=1 Tax=Pedococcus sp. KACC 23699 TaxID=3149228 RepID=A0AAU7JNP6_9MICO